MCQRSHVQNYAYANTSRRLYVRDVRQLSNTGQALKFDASPQVLLALRLTKTILRQRFQIHAKVIK